VELVKKKYWRENKKDNKLRQLKRLTIGPEETVNSFNTRFLGLYDQLETTDRTSITVKNAIRPSSKIYKRIAMNETITIEEVYSLAEKYENILKEAYYNNNNSYIRNLIRRNDRILISSFSYNFNGYSAINNYNNNAFNIWSGNNNRNHKNFRNYIRFNINNNNNNNLNINNENYNNNNNNIYIAYNLRNLKIFKPK